MESRLYSLATGHVLGREELDRAGGERFFHARGLMSAVYARILALRGEPCRLLAETVRDNSRDYPRPVPLDMFEYPPFDLTPELIGECLARMAGNGEYADIGFVESSAGTVYLFSSRHLERDYAAFLAERADVHLTLNP